MDTKIKQNTIASAVTALSGGLDALSHSVEHTRATVRDLVREVDAMYAQLNTLTELVDEDDDTPADRFGGIDNSGIADALLDCLLSANIEDKNPNYLNLLWACGCRGVDQVNSVDCDECYFCRCTRDQGSKFSLEALTRLALEHLFDDNFSMNTREEEG